MTKDEAKAIIEREPVGGEHCYDVKNDRFYSRYQGDWYRFVNGGWELHKYALYSARVQFKRMSEILAIALGDEND